MSDREIFYGQITSLVDSEDISDNFFKGLEYKENFEKQYKLFLKLDKKVKGLDILSSFNYKAKNKSINTFKHMSLTSKDNKKLIKELNKIKDDEDFLIKKIVEKDDKVIITFK